MPETDLYFLGASPPAPMPSINGELDFDLQLELAPAPTNRVVQGTVKDPDGNPVEGATVKILSAAQFNPVNHTHSNPSGRYIFNQLAPGSYLITAKAPGFVAPLVQAFTLPQSGTLSIDINLLPFPVGFHINAIFGIVRNNQTNEPIANASVTLNNITEGTPVLFATTISNAEGQYAVGNLPLGTYTVQATAMGFNASDVINVPIEGDVFAPADVFLTVNTTDTLGTVSGVITDKTKGLPISGAIVGLYQIVNEQETLIEITRTQTNGFYIFVDVPANITYRIKAKVVQF